MSTAAAHAPSTPRPRPAHRSLIAFAALGAGFVIVRAMPDFPSPVLWFAACQAVLIPALLKRGLACRVGLTAAVVLFGAGWFALRVQQVPADSLLRLIPPGPPAQGALVTVEGIVLDRPGPAPPARGALGRFSPTGESTRFTFRTSSLSAPDGDAPCTGELSVSVHCPATGIEPGQRLRLTGHFRPLEPPANPGEPDRRETGAQDHHVGRLTVPSQALIEPLGPDDSLSGRAASAWAAMLGALRARASDSLDAAVAPVPTPSSPRHGADHSTRARGRALLDALLLGQREPALDDVGPAFTRLGLVHLIAISGFNLAVMASVALFLFRFLGESRASGWLEPSIVALLVVVYMLIVPAEAPVVRSGLMVLAFLAAEASGRRYDRLTLLGWIAIALLLWRPMDLWSIGFQLSFGIVAVLLWLGRSVQDRLFGVPLRGTIQPHADSMVRAAGRAAAGYLKSLTSSSLLAWAVAAPTVACQIGLVSPLAPLTTIIVLPITVAVLWAGYIALAVGAIVPAAAAVVGWALDLLGRFLAVVVLFLDELPGMVVRLPAVSPAWAAGATGMILYWFIRGHRRDRTAWLGTLLVSAWLGVQILAATHLNGVVALRIDTLAVGDGSCHLIRAGSDAMLWDCGSTSPGIGLRQIPQAVRAVGAWRVPTVVLTHPNLDHYDGLLDVIEPLGVERVLITPAFRDDADAHPWAGPAALLAGLAERGVGVRIVAAGDAFDLGPARVTFLSPPADTAFPDANDTSLVAIFSIKTGAGTRRLVMTGDAGPGALNALLSPNADLHADVLEVPHHGSVNDAAARFVRTVDPSVVLQSTGPSRLGDHRWDPLRPGRAWLATAADGAAWAELRTDGTIAHGSFRR